MSRLIPSALVTVAVSAVASSLLAAPPSENLLPDTTKGYVSVPDVDALRAQWDKTQLGQMVNDPAMKPFVDDLKRQISGRLKQAGVRLGLSIEDLDGVYGGEVAMASIQPGGKAGTHAQAIIVDITDHHQQAQELLEKVTKSLTSQGATRSTEQVGDVQMVVFTLRKQRGETTAGQAVYFVHQDRLVAVDNKSIAKRILARFSGDAKDTLAQVTAYQKTMAHCAKRSGETAKQIRWFAEPFGYLEVMRAAGGGRKKRGTDLLKVLRNQGFAAVSGIGGFVSLATDKHEILHRTMVYAPSNGPERFELAARMLNFPNAQPLDPQAWVPAGVANYISLNWKIREAFEYSKTLFNEIAGAKGDEDLFEDIVRSIATDPMGPQIDVREDLVRYFAERVTVISDYRLPITPKSERLLFAVKLTDASAVAATIEKAMKADPDAKRRIIEGHVVWEIIEEAPAEVEEIKIDSPFGPSIEEEVPIEPEESDAGPLGGEPLMTNLAITVAEGHLMIGTHVDFVADVLKTAKNQKNLAPVAAHTRITEALGDLGAAADSFQFFSQTDKAYRPTYELLRKGKMPESETMLGKLLNRAMGPDEKGVLREQQIDGSKMPEFTAVEKYLGPAGLYVNSLEDGWFITGCLLKK